MAARGDVRLPKRYDFALGSVFNNFEMPGGTSDACSNASRSSGRLLQ